MYKAEQNGEVVYILNHFSINTYFLIDRKCFLILIEWGYRYRILIDRYTNILRGIFSGHTHEDSFQIIRSKGSNDIASVIHILPALTTYPQENPSFRLYTADRKTSTILDYTQYRLYLNKIEPNKEPIWEVAYSFKDFFKLPTMDFLAAVEKLKVDRELFNRYVRNFWGEGPRGDELLENYKSAFNFIMCRLLCSDLFEYLDCVGSDYGNSEFAFGYGFLARFLNLQWEYAYNP